MTVRRIGSTLRSALEKYSKRMPAAGRLWCAALVATAALVYAPESASSASLLAVSDANAPRHSTASHTRSFEETVKVGTRAPANRAMAPAGPRTGPHQANRASALRSMPSDSIVKWRRLLDKIAKASKRGESAVTLRRIVLYAMTAPSDAEFHSRIAQLPVTITDSAGAQDGVFGHYRNYGVRGVTRASFFVRDGVGNRNFSRDEDRSWIDGEGERISVADPALARAENAGGKSMRDCSMTSPYDNLYYEGDCATEEDIDDGMAAIAAMDAEINYDYAEASCDPASDPQQCGASDDALGPEANVSAPRYESVDMREDGSENSALPDFVDLSLVSGCTASGPIDAAGKPDAHGNTRRGCVQQGLDAAAGILGWGLAKYGAYLVLTSVEVPPVGAVVAAVAGSILAGWGAVSGVASYLTCYGAK